MRLADLAWNQVDTTTIRNCWRKSGILPDNASPPEALPPPSIPITSLLSSPPPRAPPTDPVIHAENDIINSLAELEKRGVLLRANRMDIDELLNPVLEREIIATDVTDNEIFESVHECRQGEETMEINGGDDDEIVNIPSHRDALAASLVLQRYVADLNDPRARELEDILTGFGRQVRLQQSREMEPTLITSYFASNHS
ncbi:hypothetical protein BGW80DRAFT_1183061 [Lactifluus volemus]|nr:hypothetical protein BGW80DRAFT_1183061 [Lactifluus volemus]